MTAMGSGDSLPLSLLARMIKYVILKRRVKDTTEKEATSIEVCVCLNHGLKPPPLPLLLPYCSRRIIAPSLVQR